MNTPDGLIILKSLSLVGASLIGMMILDVAGVHASRIGILPKSTKIDSLRFIILNVLGFFTTAWGAQSLSHQYSQIPPYFFLSLPILYLTGLIVFMEGKSIFSRGYTFRFMVDLLQGSSKSQKELIRDYGGGKGIDGMLRKRIEWMASLKLISLDGNTVGPLSPIGSLMAWMGHLYRQLIKLKEVG